MRPEQECVFVQVLLPALAQLQPLVRTAFRFLCCYVTAPIAHTAYASSRPFSFGPVGRVRVEDLLKRKGIETTPGVFRRMLQTFPNQVDLAEARDDPELAIDAYYQTEALPSFNTELHFKADGFQLNGHLFPGSSLVTAYRGATSFVVKSHPHTHERERVLIFSAAVRISSHNSVDCYGILTVHQHVIPFKIWVDQDRPERMFMIMPKLPSTLEPIARLSPELIVVCWKNIGSALRFVHGLGFSHGDVKPANIGVREGLPEEFVLLDLGSMQRFGLRAYATEPYVPKDLPRSPTGFITATECLDWWMLAMTICEKGCDMEVGVGGARGRSAPPRGNILKMCSGHQGSSQIASELLLELSNCKDDVALTKPLLDCND